MRYLLVYPQLRTAIPRLTQRRLQIQLWARYKSHLTQPRPSQQHERTTAEAKKPATIARTPTPTTTPSKTVLRRGTGHTIWRPPERILVYYGGTGRAMFLGILRVTTILLFGAACLVIAPIYDTAENEWYMKPLVIAGGALPMIFVAYTSAPYVNFIHLALPSIARKSREAALLYIKDLPPTATLYINTMRFNTIPRQTKVMLGDLIAERDPLRPVAFRNLKPLPKPWWMGRPTTQFFTAANSHPGRQSMAFYPEAWPDIYKRIQLNAQK
ncbi:hypothetical protein N7495_006874 [Penicillium taxi]|uniref:uncharacterized protein n=1 Tax=Penicillium taxi TaxID=168475 RepID=UPI0025452029|nr:uncharacterized protein N7495_006874 [Penicillium taxi]KAJ5895183.1 hypothetical protein N7495_006874 [Penicillium taxi]